MPLRLRSLPVLLVPTAAAVPVIAWALSKDAFTEDLVPLAARESVAGEFGVLLFLMCLVLLAAGLVLGFGATRRPPLVALRRRVGMAAAVAACLRCR